MKATVQRTDITYEVSFKKPLISQTGRDAIFTSLYESMAENFLVTLTDVTINAGPSPANIAAAISLFGGAASIVMRLDSWRAEFRNIQSEDDRKLALRCLNLAAGAIESSDRVLPARRTATVASWLACEEGEAGVATLLRQYGSPGKIEADFLGAAELDFAINPTLRNPTEGWDSTFYISRSQLSGTHLFVNYIGHYIEGGRYNSIDQLTEHVRFMLRGMLEKLGVQLPS